MREEDKKVYVYTGDYYNYIPPYFGEKVYDIDSLCRVAKRILVLNIDGKRRKLIETDNRRCRKFLEGIGVIDDDAHLSEFPFPFQPELSGSGYYDRYITYEKNVGGDIVYKTEYFDGYDPALDITEHYTPVVREGVEWGHKAVVCDTETGVSKKRNVYYRECLEGDTVIDNKIYKKCYRYKERYMYRRTADLVSFMREEDKKVYVRVNFNRGDENLGVNIDENFDGFKGDRLVYDFNISNIGDQIKISPYGTDIYDCKVKGISDITIEGRIRKQYDIEGLPVGSIWIEGIGLIDEDASDFGFPYQVSQMSDFNKTRNITFERDCEEIVYKTPYFDANDPAIRPEGIARVSDGAADVPVYGTEEAAVIEGDGVGYAVYSADGRQAATGIADGKTEIPLPSGLYIVRTGSRATKIAVK